MSGISRVCQYRRRLKLQFPDRYAEYLIKQKARGKARRDKMREELNKEKPSQLVIHKQELERAKARERQRRYIQRKKGKNQTQLFDEFGSRMVSTRHSDEQQKNFKRKQNPGQLLVNTGSRWRKASRKLSKEEKQENWRAAKLKQRSKWTMEQWMLNRLKDRERKRKVRQRTDMTERNEPEGDCDSISIKTELSLEDG